MVNGGFKASDFEWDDIVGCKPKRPLYDYIREASESRSRELEAAIQRFRDCGVELARFSIQERGEVTHLCVDGASRFSWRIDYGGAGQAERMQ